MDLSRATLHLLQDSVWETVRCVLIYLIAGRAELRLKNPYSSSFNPPPAMQVGVASEYSPLFVHHLDRRTSQCFLSSEINGYSCRRPPFSKDREKIPFFGGTAHISSHI